MEKHVGQKIKELREIKGISLEDLASRSGLDVDQIRQIEEQASIPSLGPLQKVARSLGVRIGTFLDDNEELGPVLTKAGNRKAGKSFSSNNSDKHAYMDYFALAGDKAGRHMEPFIVNIQPSPDNDFNLSSHEGEEFIICFEGKVEIIYGKDTYVLEEGDSIYYDSIVKHSVHGFNNQSAKILAVIYSPS